MRSLLVTKILGVWLTVLAAQNAFASGSSCSSLFIIKNGLVAGSAFSLKQFLVEKKSPAELSRTLYGDKGVEVLRRLENIHPSFATLLTDFGLVQRLSSFEKFVSANDLSGVDPQIARNKFAIHLGQRTVYRALALTAAEHKFLMKNGIKSHVARDLESSPEGRQAAEKRLAESDITELLKRRVQSSAQAFDPFLSVSEIPEVALAVAAEYLAPEKSVYLYKVVVSELDLVRPKVSAEVFRSRSSKGVDLKVRDSSLNELAEYNFGDARIESFIFDSIPASAIFEAKKYSRKELPRIQWLISPTKTKRRDSAEPMLNFRTIQ